MMREAMTTVVFTREQLLGSRLENLDHMPPKTSLQLVPTSIGHSTLPQLPLTWASQMFLFLH